MKKKAKNTLKGAVEYVSDILPSPEEIWDEVGNFIAQLLCSPKRFENRAELRKKIATLKETLTGAINTDGIISEISQVLDKFEETVGEALCGAEKNLKKARILALGWALAVGAVILDIRWKSLFDLI